MLVPIQTRRIDAGARSTCAPCALNSVSVCRRRASSSAGPLAVTAMHRRSRHPGRSEVEHGAAACVPRFRFFTRTHFQMQDPSIRSPAMRASGLMHRSRILGRLFKVAPSTLHRRDSLHHQHQGDSRYPHIPLPKIADIMMQFVQGSLNSFPLVTRCTLKSGILHASDLRVSRLLVGAPGRYARLTTQKLEVFVRILLQELIPKVCSNPHLI